MPWVIPGYTSVMRVPDRVTVGVFAGSVMAVAAWMSDAFAGVVVPAEVAVAAATALTWLLQRAWPEALKDEVQK